MRRSKKTKILTTSGKHPGKKSKTKTLSAMTKKRHKGGKRKPMRLK